MKLALKLVLAIVIGIVLVLSVDGYFRVRRQLAVFEVDMKRDHAAMGRALAEVVADVWEAEGEKKAFEIVENVDRRKADLSIKLLGLDAFPNSIASMQEAARVQQTVLDGGLATTFLDHDDGSPHLHTYIPVIPVDIPVAVVELSESFATHEAFVRATVIRAVFTTIATALICSLLVLLLGMFFVGRPLKRLVEKTRRLGAGDFGAPLKLRQHDEVAILADEMNLMAERLAEANARVARETSARIAALEQLRHADRLTTVGRLASGIAHEVGTPLNVISGRAKMIARGESQGDEVRESSVIIADQADRITRIVRQLLDFARRREPRKESVDLRHAVEGTFTLFKHMAEKKGVKMVQVNDGVSTVVEADGTLIQQVLTNLVLNGIQAMPGGGWLTLSYSGTRRKPPPEVGSEEGEYLCLSVEDQGEGISEENLPRLFDPFFTTKDVGEGTGLGLSVAYGIVKEHGGWIDVESAPGWGSVFFMYLPRTGSGSNGGLARA
jgi:two-component system NtrC family sensor kinase